MTPNKLPPLPEPYCQALKEGDWDDYSYTDDPKCPHCGRLYDISKNEAWRLYEEGQHDVTCLSCNMDFSVSAHVTYAFSTDTQKDYP